jgi:ATP-dependent helicase HepA
VLLICRTRALAEQIHEQLLRELNVKCGALPRRPHAAPARSECRLLFRADGARILICSEIGSEGATSNCASPRALTISRQDPELLEQRSAASIASARARRSRSTCRICASREAEVPREVVSRRSGAFEKNLHGAARIAHPLAEELRRLRQSFEARAAEGIPRPLENACAQRRKKREAATIACSS